MKGVSIIGGIFLKKFMIGLVALILVFLGFRLYSTYTFTFEDRKVGELIGSIESPDQKYTAKYYQIPYGGAAGGVFVRIEVVSLPDDWTKTIYYGEGKSSFHVQWVNESILQITNRHQEYPEADNSMKLNVLEDIFDETGRACKSWVMKDSYVNCYLGKDAPNF